MQQRPLVALADPEWIGHRETYFREFTLSLGRVDADVIALCPEPSRLKDDCIVASSTLTEPRRLPFLQRWPHDPINTGLRWRRLAKALALAEEKIGRGADFVFLPWLDSYLRASVHPRVVSTQFHRPWAGLYFRPHHLLESGAGRGSFPSPGLLQGAAKGDALLRSSSCLAVATLDETLRPILEGVSHKPVVLFPDITDERAPDGSSAFAQQIVARAAGRKVIGLIGMEPRKGVVTMLKAAEVARAQGRPWLFVLAGMYYADNYAEADRSFIEQTIARARAEGEASNVLFPDEFGPISDGLPFNNVMNCFDVLFVAYHDFLGSSNVLTKAAILHKPVICTDLGCIAHRTRSYGLGVAIPQGDATACCAALDHVLKGEDWEGQPLRPRYAEYHAEHDRARLDASMRTLISLAPVASRSARSDHALA